MKRRIAAAVLYAVVSALGPGDATAAMNALDDDADDEESSTPSLLALIDRDGSPGATEGGAKSEAGVGDGDPLLKRVSRALGTPVDAAWVVRTRPGLTAAVAVQANPHTSVATINAEVMPATWAADEKLSTLRLPLARALAHCRDRGYLKVVLTADGAAVALLRSWVESRGFQFSRARWVDGAPAAEFYTDLYWSGGEPSSRRESHHAA